MHAQGQHEANEKRKSNGVKSAELQEPARHRYPEGWRAGKPEEDPAKMKRWGVISARPSEFLIRMRGGKVVTSGQGASCFKWPWDSVAVVPTTVQRLHFVADQVTSEKVGVQITGLAVYRIAEPLIAFRMLNFSFPERASEKLEQLLVEMFVGAARRLVANLTVEQCLSRRKEGISAELMREVAPVVSGHGRPEDRTVQGWGVVIDTIEIQDVRVLSQAVFANMQARFRQEQERVAKEAELSKERAMSQQKAEAERQIQLTRLAAEAEIRQRKLEEEQKAKLELLATESRVREAKLSAQRAAQQEEAEAEREVALAKLAAQLEVSARKQAAAEQAQLEELSAQTRMEEARLAQERAVVQGRLAAEAERARLEAEAQAVKHEAQLAVAHQQAQLRHAEAAAAQARCALLQAELDAAQLDTQRRALAQELELALQRSLKELANAVSPEVIQLTLAQSLPQLAAAFQQKMGEIHVTAVDGSNPLGFVAATMEGVLSLARSAGLKLPGDLTPSSGDPSRGT